MQRTRPPIGYRGRRDHEIELLGFANIKIVYRKYMDAVLVARKP